MQPGVDLPWKVAGKLQVEIRGPEARSVDMNLWSQERASLCVQEGRGFWP